MDLFHDLARTSNGASARHDPKFQLKAHEVPIEVTCPEKAARQDFLSDDLRMQF